MQNDDQYEYRLVTCTRTEEAKLCVKFPRGEAIPMLGNLDVAKVMKTHPDYFSAWAPTDGKYFSGYSWAYAEPITKEEAEQHSVYELPVK